MAKTTCPLLSLSANKSIAGVLTFQNRVGGNVAYKKTKPGDIKITAPSWKQLNQRVIIGLLIAQWQCMTTSEKLVWENEAAALGEKGTGYHYFIKIAQTNLYTHHGLVAYWSFNEVPSPTVADLSGNGNTGTLYPTYPTTCAVPTDSKNSKFGKALEFDWNIDYIDCGNSNRFNLQTMTLLAWIYSRGNNPNEIIRKQPDARDPYRFYHNTSTNNHMILQLSQDATKRTFFETTAAMSRNKWHHVAASWSGSAANMYIDGVSKAFTTTGALPTSIRVTTNSLRIGIRPGQGISGKLDEIRVYNRVLSKTEILKQYQLINP